MLNIRDTDHRTLDLTLLMGIRAPPIPLLDDPSQPVRSHMDQVEGILDSDTVSTPLG